MKGVAAFGVGLAMGLAGRVRAWLVSRYHIRAVFDWFVRFSMLTFCTLTPN